MNEDVPYISELKLKNVGRFEDLTLELSPFTLLVGPNDAGKTTVLNAIQTVIGAKKFDLEQVRRVETNEVGRADTATIQILINNPPDSLITKANLEDDDHSGFRMTWEVTEDEDGNASLDSPDYEILVRVPEDDRLHEWKYKAPQEKEILSDYGLEPGSNQAKREEQYEQLKEEILRDPEQTCLAWISAYQRDFLEYGPGSEQINSNDVDAPVNILRELLKQETDAILHIDESGEKVKISELTEIEDMVSESLNERLESLTERMKRHLDDLEEIQLDPQWDFVRGADFSDITLIMEDDEIPFHELGGGTVARSALSMLEWSSESHEGKDSVIRTMDEPDHRLHFDSQRQLINLLRQDVSNSESYLSQCIVSTHSMIMVDSTPLHEVLYIPDDIQSSETRSPLLSKDEASADELMGNIMAGLGLSASWVYLERAMIVVEGATEHNYIREIYHKITDNTLVEDGVQVWDSQGCGHIVKTLKRLKRSGNARTFVILDSDAKTKNFSDGLLGDHLEEMYETGGDNPELVWVGEKELEDSWELDDLVRLAEEHWPRDNGEDWERSHFEPINHGDKPSDQLVTIIRRGCASNLPDCPSLNKVQIGLRMGRLEGVTHPEPVVDLIEHVHEFCNQV